MYVNHSAIHCSFKLSSVSDGCSEMTNTPEERHQAEPLTGVALDDQCQQEASTKRGKEKQ